MNILFLNTWNAELREDLTRYLASLTSTVDVFCFQEALDEATAVTSSVLSDYAHVACRKPVSDKHTFALSTYVNKSLVIDQSAVIFEDDPSIGFGLSVRLSLPSGPLQIINFHGAPQPNDKLDEPNRLRASTGIIQAANNTATRTIIGGDFNLFPDTRSIQTFGDHGYLDLIRIHHIDTTRNHYVWDRYPVKQYYSDYVFVGSDLHVTQFAVPKIDVSDHLPLLVSVQ